MAGHAVTDAAALKQREKELWDQLHRARREMRWIEQQISQIQLGRVYDDTDRNWIPNFLRKTA